MNSSITIQSELDGFIETLQRIGETDATTEAATAVVHEMGRETASLAYKYAPKKTGALANSIEIEYGDRTARVVARAPHAIYVEFGTWSHNLISPKQGTYTIRPKRPGGVLRFTGKDGKTVFTRKVEHPGVKAQPFLAPANAEVIDKFTRGIADVGVYLLMEETP